MANKNEEYIEIIDEIVEGLGLKLVSYKLIRQKNDVKAKIDIHKPKDFISHEDCAMVHRVCESFLVDKFGDNVYLEVSSPGINRILKTEREFKVFKGYEVELYFNINFLKSDANKNNIKNGNRFILKNYNNDIFYLVPLDKKKSGSKSKDKKNDINIKVKKNDVNILDEKDEEVIEKGNITKIKLIN